MPTSSSAYRSSSVATASSLAKTRTKVASSSASIEKNQTATCSSFHKSSSRKETKSNQNKSKQNNNNDDDPSTRPSLATAEILEKATLSLHGLSTRDVLTVWKALGLYLSDQLVARRRVVSIDRFGVFGYNDASEAVFLHSPVFLQSNRLREGTLARQALRGQPALAANATPMSKINAAEMSLEYLQNCGREIVLNVVAHVVAFIGTMAKQGRALRLSLLPLGEWVCSPESKVEFVFQADFQQRMVQSMANLKKIQDVTKQRKKTATAMKENEEVDEEVEAVVREPESVLTPKALQEHTTREHTVKATKSMSKASAPSSHMPSQAASRAKRTAHTGTSSGSHKRLAWSESSDHQSSHETQPKERPQTATTSHSTTSRARAVKKTKMKVTSRGGEGAADKGVVGRVRAKLLARCGDKGLNALQRVLSLLDTSGDGVLSAQELKFGLRDLGIELTASELQQVVAHFDRNNDGVVDLEELLGRLRGDQLSERRRTLIEQAFDCMDPARHGVVSLEQLRDNYDVSLLPRVRAGKKTKQQALSEFVREWETSVEHNNGIPKVAFVEYYHNMSACIADDSDFELLMRQTWHVSPPNDDDSESPDTSDDDGGANEELISSQHRQETLRPTTSGSRTSASPPTNATKGWPYLSSVVLPPPRGVHSKPSLDDVCRRLGVNRVWGDGNETMNTRAFAKALASLDRQLTIQDAEQLTTLVGHHCSSTMSSSDMISLSVLYQLLLNPPRASEVSSSTENSTTGSGTANSVIERIRSRLLQRLKAQQAQTEGTTTTMAGTTAPFLGLHALQRTLWLLDANNDKRLSKDELKFGLRKLGVEINFHELDHLFTCLDADRSGCIDTDEFLTAMRGGADGDMNQRRRALVTRAFELLDKDHSGTVTLDELSQAYDTSKHPDVIAGRLSAQGALRQFAQQWETQEKDGVVTKREFEIYYGNVSAMVESDDYFELMMRNAWHISGGVGHCANSTNRRVLVTSASGSSQRVVEVENDLGIHARDTTTIRAKLNAQGALRSDQDEIGLTGYVECKKQQQKTQPKPALASSNQARGRGAPREATPSHNGATGRAAPTRAEKLRGATVPGDFFGLSTSSSSSTVGEDACGGGGRNQRLQQRQLRERAALLIQSQFRGFKSRKFVECVRRQQAAQRARRQNDEQQQQQQMGRQRVVARTALKSHYGF